MIPLRDNNPTSSFPLITVALIAINVIVYFFLQNPVFNAQFAMIPREVVTGQDYVGVLHAAPDGSTHFYPGSVTAIFHTRLDPHVDIPLLPSPHPLWLTIFTAMFMHGSILHLGGNMLFLWIFGNNVEDALGKLRFLAFYLFCGVAAALAQIAIDPGSLIPTLGASGAIAGVLAAYIVMWPDARVLTLIFLGIFFTWRDISAFWVIGIWIALQIIQGVTGLGGMATGGVAYFAHIGGFAAGLLLILIMGGRGLGQKQLSAARYSRLSY